MFPSIYTDDQFGENYYSGIKEQSPSVGFSFQLVFFFFSFFSLTQALGDSELDAPAERVFPGQIG